MARPRSSRRPGIPAGAWFARQSFHSFLTHPTTGPRLDAMLADNAAADAAILAERDERDDQDEDRGSTCGAACGFCGRCS